VAATAAAANLTIICPEYRLAPEHPFPAGLNDALSVYKAMIKDQGYKPENIVFVGDSAGGGMVAAMALQLQREGVPLPAALGMFSPWSDATEAGDTKVTMTGLDPIIAGLDPISPTDAPSGGIIYVGGNVSQLQNPLVSPVQADWAELFPKGSLPPTLIQVGLREVLLSDAVRLYHKMRKAAARGHVVLSPYEGMWHNFQGYVNISEAAVASQEMGEHFDCALKGRV
jgi:acetyl esterase/lipase